jgi:hypothetical protein
MLASVPAGRRAAPEFQKAVDRMAHLVAARRRWLNRLGHWPEAPEAFPRGTALGDLPGLVADAEAAWVRYLAGLGGCGAGIVGAGEVATGRDVCVCARHATHLPMPGGGARPGRRGDPP